MEPLGYVTKDTWKTSLLLQTEDVSDVASATGTMGCNGAILSIQSST